MPHHPLFRVVLSTIVLALGTLIASAGEIEWHTDPVAAWDEAAVEGRPLLIFVTMPGCHYCVAMKRNTFADAAVATRIERGFVPLLLDSERNARYVERLRIRSFPTILIASHDRTLLAESHGFQPAAKFQKLLDSAQRRHQTVARRKP